jgi:curved DNA-binding protein CbpA
LSLDRYQGHVFNPADLAEEVDLDVAQRKAILHAEAKLPEWSHWQVLGLPWNASIEAVRAAYIEQVKIFHPDRYPGRKLGSYRTRLERVFRRVTEARDVLTSEALQSWPGALAAYRAALEIDPSHSRALILASRAATEVGDVGSARELAEQAVRSQPRSAPAHEALGNALEASGKRADARKALERAVEIDPRLESAKERLKKLRWSFLG